jgi:hypothetical protein
MILILLRSSKENKSITIVLKIAHENVALKGDKW